MSIKIYDCSNSEERPAHRGKGGPKENDVMRYLKKYASDYGCEFVDNPYKATLLITNDVFPKKFHESWLPKVKRMDGVYFQEQYRERNIPLNQSALLADHVIFISEFSRRSYNNLYGDALKSASVALNQVDTTDFFPQLKLRDVTHYLVSSATSWEREEKRLNDIVRFCEVTKQHIQLIGTIPTSIQLPKNVHRVGYVNDTQITNWILNSASVFLNFSYKDAAPKTVLQGLCCGLPVFYADSGGLPELVEDCGVGIEENAEDKFESSCPEINMERMLDAWDKFQANHKALQEAVLQRDNESKFRSMLDQYFKVIKRVG